MKIRIDNYVFDKTAKTVTFNDYSSLDLGGLLLITNVTDGIIIFNFADPLAGGVLTGNVLTLAYDTSSMSNTDKLLIYYDDTDVAQANDITLAIRNIAQILANPAYLDKSANQLRAQITGSLTNLTTLATLTNMSLIDNYQGKLLVINQNSDAWSNVVRRTISS